MPCEYCDSPAHDAANHHLCESRGSTEHNSSEHHAVRNERGADQTLSASRRARQAWGHKCDVR